MAERFRRKRLDEDGGLVDGLSLAIPSAKHRLGERRAIRNLK